MIPDHPSPHRFPPTGLAFAVVLALAVACAKGPAPLTAPETARPVSERFGPAALARVLAIQDRHTDALLAAPGVVGVGTGLGRDGAPVLRVFVASEDHAALPREVEGVPVDVRVAGPFEPWALTSRVRPLAIGISLDNDQQCSIGTLGCVVSRANRRYVLSCNHVLARMNAATLGEPIVQPAREDNRPNCSDHGAADQVAVLSDFEPLRFDGSDNRMDAAIAQLLVPSSCATPSGFYGLPGTTAVPATLGLAVQKVGRTTELTTGQITAIHAAFDIAYPAGTARLVDLIVTTNGFGKRGDSGSLMVTNDPAKSPVGLVFGGDPRGSGLAIPIDVVLSRFGVEICGE